VVENKAPKREKTPDICPHCGKKLSSWEQVILSVDRMLMCKNCWYRITLDTLDRDNLKNDHSKG
jgi:DNA-directed RNA polymerase subunit RPC12/RpoP